MESSGSVLRHISYSTVSRESRKVQLGFRTRRVCMGSGFSNEGHLQYYATPLIRCGGGAMKEGKKKMKLIKELSKNLSSFCTIGFGVETGEGLVGEGKEELKTISEATDILMVQLEQLRTAEKEMKKKRKEEKAAMKAAEMKKKDFDCEDSSSSSCESSESDCEEVISMSKKRNCGLLDAKTGSLAGVIEAPKLEETMKQLVPVHEPQDVTDIGIGLKYGPEGSSITSGAGTTISCSAVVRAAPSERIEVCMGGKCKKSGALALMEEFEKKVGVEVAVVGCKCMGKCKEGPNARVLNHSNEEHDSIRIPKNPLCIGVRLEDVGDIVAKFFGESKDLGLQAA